MKFITSMIIPNKKAKSLAEIIKEEQAKTEKEEVRKIATANSDTKKIKKASTKKTTIKKEAQKNVKKEETSKAIEKENKVFSKEYNIKKVKASKNKSANNVMGIVFKKLKSEAALTKEDRDFLIRYYKLYYPADFAEALVAQYN